MKGINLITDIYVNHNTSLTNKTFKIENSHNSYNYIPNYTHFKVICVNEVHKTLEIRCNYADWGDVDILKADPIFLKYFFNSTIIEV